MAGQPGFFDGDCSQRGALCKVCSPPMLAVSPFAKANRMIKIDRHNVGRIAERIIANELEARGFRVSDLNKDGPAAAISRNQTLQIQVKGATNGPQDEDPWWVGYGYNTRAVINGQEPMFNRLESFYTADIVVLVAVRSPGNYSSIVLPIKEAEQAAQLHLDANWRGERAFRRDGQPKKPGKMWVALEPPTHARAGDARWVEERALLANYRDKRRWARLLKSA
jgi:hypothetical protein